MCSELATTITGSQPLYFHVWEYLQYLVYEHKVDLSRRIADANDGNNCLDPRCRMTRSVVKRARMRIEAEAEHSEHLLQKREFSVCRIM
jgi:hypothetical protein